MKLFVSTSYMKQPQRKQVALNIKLEVVEVESTEISIFEDRVEMSKKKI